jgi:hypothetical protein
MTTDTTIGETGRTNKSITLKNFLEMQEQEILKFRWIESEKAKKDLTGIAEIDWINRYAESFRKYVEDTYGSIR